ncbi:GNAT family N-acetyltransferase [Pokkaliibacter sp. CJK22405]|uniref:GNAT family N-acetyltransferase n=1 Tax=Pokkaliibacter sp. CJK22405 TaxID=3384615 RepID=UPI003985027D
MIRAFLPSDRSAVESLWQDTENEISAYYHPAWRSYERLEQLDHVLEQGETWVYLHQLQVVGFISLVDNEIVCLCVEPEHRGKGIGCTLLNHVRCFNPELTAVIYESNRQGRHFYDRYGFVTSQRFTRNQDGQALLLMQYQAPFMREATFPMFELPMQIH